MAKRSRHPFRRLLGWVLVLAVLAGLGYYGLLRLKLGSALSGAPAASRSYRWSLASGTETPVKSSLPFVLRVSVKRDDMEDWLPDGERGLVERRLAWDPGAFAWVDDPPAPLPLEKQAALVQLSMSLPGTLIDALADADPHRREVAARALRRETGQDLGYRFDASSGSRETAVAAWREWWEKNKLIWIQQQAEKMLKGGAPAGSSGK